MDNEVHASLHNVE